jgi:hypothetical protein
VVALSQVAGDGDLDELRRLSRLRQFFARRKSTAPSRSRISSIRLSVNCRWYSRPSARSRSSRMRSSRRSWNVERLSNLASVTTSPSSESLPSSPSSAASSLPLAASVAPSCASSMSSARGTKDLWDQMSVVLPHLTSRKKIGGTGWTDWTRCLQMRKRLSTRFRQVQVHFLGSGLYCSLRGRVIGVFAAFFQARLKAFRHEGSSRNRPLG